MRFVVVLTFCLVLTLGSAFSPIELASDSEIPDDLMECIDIHPNAVEACSDAYFELMKKHQDEIMKHKTEQWNLPEYIRKDLCCGLWVNADCAIDAVRGTVGCPDKMRKYFDELMAKSDMQKICGTKFSRSGCKK